jgi:multicomponent Na+:H+ antiporter subunit E
MLPTAHPVHTLCGEDRPHKSTALRLLVTGLALSAVWVTLVGSGDPSSWIVGLPSVAAATWSHGRLSACGGLRFSVAGALQLVPFFLLESFKGGVDVVRRVVGPRLDVNPGFFDYGLRLTRPSARIFFVGLVSLLPGTLSADIDGEILRVHALDRDVDSVGELSRLERHVAALFRESLCDPAVPDP